MQLCVGRGRGKHGEGRVRPDIGSLVSGIRRLSGRLGPFTPAKVLLQQNSLFSVELVRGPRE